MNQTIKQLWLTALRSGEYQQGHGRLRNGDTRCCLGVLCELAHRQGIGQWLIDGDNPAVFVETDYKGEIKQSNDAVPTTAVLVWAGLKDGNPFAGDHTLAEYNDGSGLEDVRPHSFTEIADLIEEHL